MKKLLLFSIIIALAPALLSTAMAQAPETVTVPEVAQKVDIAGRQRMLSQRIAKAVCLMVQDISFGTAFDQLTQAFSLFQRSDTALRSGNENMGLREETVPEVLDALANVDVHWNAYSAIIDNSINTGTIENAELELLDDASLNVLKYMNIAVFKITRAYNSLTIDVPLGLTITIDIAGRQRMLIQKAVKEACLMTVSSDPMTYADRLAETVELFNLSLDALRDGYQDVGVIAAPSREIDRKLQEVVDLWEPVKEILDRAAAGEVLSDRDLGQVARSSEPLLRTMNEAVGMYGR